MAYIVNLPIIVQKQILSYLNSLEEVNYLTAIDLVDKKSDFFQYLFNDKQINLSKCDQLKNTDLKPMLKYYKKELDILSLDLNFCYNLSWTNGLRTLNLQNLSVLKIMSIKISTPDLIGLVTSCCQLQEIAFTVPETYTSGEKYKSYSRGKSYTSADNLKGFNQIETISLEFKPGFDRIIFENLMDNFTACQHLEFYSKDEITVRTHKQLPELTSFASSGKVYLTITELADFLGLLDQVQLFSLNVRKVNNLNRMYAKSVDFFRIENLKDFAIRSKLKRFHYHFERGDLNFLQSRENTNEELIDLELNGVTKLLESDFLFHLQSFKLSTADSCECVLKTVKPFALQSSAGSNLRAIDLKDIHIHSTDSICELLAELKHLESLHLPCCALACEDWKTKDTKYILKRIFVDDEGESEKKTNEPKRAKKQLSYLSKLDIQVFGLYAPKNVSKKDVYYNCRTVDYAELMELGNFPELRQVYFDGFKLLGSPLKFELIIKKLIESKLTHLSFVQFSSFVLYEHQTKLTNNLEMFSELTHIRIEHKDFHITEGFLEKLASLSKLSHIKILTKKIDGSVFKNNAFSYLNKMKKLTCLELESDFSNKDISELNKLFKSSFTFASIRKFTETTHIRDLTSILSIANMSPKYQSDDFF